MGDALIFSKRSIFVFFIFHLLILRVSVAQPLTEIQLYKRCYNHLTQKPVSLNDSRAIQIKNGQLRATQACRDLINTSELQGDGFLKNSNNENLAILRTLNSFHKSFFQVNNVEQIPDYSIELNRGTEDAYDPSEPSMTLTYNLLRNEPFKNVLNYGTGFRAIRSQDGMKSLISGFGSAPAPFLGTRRFAHSNSENIHVKSRSVAGTTGQLFAIPFLNFTDASGQPQVISLSTFYPNFFDPGTNYQRPISDMSQMPLLRSGDVIGIRPTTESYVVPHLTLQPSSDFLMTKPGDIEPNLEFQFNFFQTFGGGIIGQPVFYLMNYGHNLGVKFNGTTKLPRRWSRSVYESFLCLSFPNLRENDITSYLNTNSSVGFRTQKSCLQCHGTLDQAAMTARNLVTGSLDDLDIIAGDNQFTRFPMVVTKYRSIQNNGDFWPSEPDPQFHLQNPQGRILYRAHNGQLVNQPVSSIADFAQKLSETDDFYSCAAKRYFEYFTGKSVPLYDRSDPRNAEMNRKLNESQIRDRKTVEQLGKNLKQHQSLKRMIAEIIETDIYRDENYDPK